MAKTVEVDEEEVRKLVGLQQQVNTLWQNPKARLLVQEAMKHVDPNAKTPDLDRQKEISQPVEDVRKEFREYVAKQEAEKAENDKNNRLAALQKTQDDGFAALKRQKYTDDGLAAVKKLMDEKGILDPLDAAAIFERQNPPPAPVTPGGIGNWNFTDIPDPDGSHKLHKQLLDGAKTQQDGPMDSAAMQLAWDAINEVRGVTRR